MVVTRLFLIICAIGSLCFAQETSYLCQPSPDVAQALAALPPADDLDLTWEQRVGPVRALLKRYPNNLFVQLRYQDTILPRYWLADELERALALYRLMPDKTISQYLEARLLWHSEVQRSRETLDRLVETEPRFPWPHLTLVEMTELPGKAGGAEPEAHLRAFLNACPDGMEAYDHFKSVGDPEMIRSGAAHLRQLLSKRADATVWRYYPDLWELEFRGAPKAEHDKTRQQVRDDVKLLQLLEAVPSRSWYRAFKQASELAQDPSISNWLNATILSKFPDSRLAVDIAEQRWMEQNPMPSTGKPEDFKKWNEQHFEATEKWLQRWPNAWSLLAEEWRDVRMLPDLPTEKVLTIIDKYAEVGESRPDVVMSVPPLSVLTAEEYVKRKVRLDRVPNMIEFGLRQAETQQKYQLDPELIPAELRGQRIDDVAFTRHRAGIVLADLFLFSRQNSKAEDVLAEISADLEAQKPPGSASPRDQNQYRYQRREYLQRLAQLEEAEGKEQDALARYQEVLQQLPRRTLEEEKDDYVRAAKQLYLKQGGKPENWLAWATSPEKASHSETTLSFSAPLPDFAVTDLGGRTWRLKNLKGKVTLLDFWATWCGACRGELPYIQKVYDQVKDHKDLQVVTINVDDNPGLIEGYLKETHFTFPILPAKDLAEKIFPVLMLPQTWFVDSEGRRSQEQVAGAGDEWVTRIIAQMERVGEPTH